MKRRIFFFFFFWITGKCCKKTIFLNIRGWSEGRRQPSSDSSLLSCRIVCIFSKKVTEHSLFTVYINKHVMTLLFFLEESHFCTPDRPRLKSLALLKTVLVRGQLTSFLSSVFRSMFYDTMFILQIGLKNIKATSARHNEVCSRNILYFQKIPGNTWCSNQRNTHFAPQATTNYLRLTYQQMMVLCLLFLTPHPESHALNIHDHSSKTPPFLTFYNYNYRTRHCPLREDAS